MREALASPHRVRELFITDDATGAEPDLAAAATAAGVRVVPVTDRVAHTLSDTVHPQGAVAVVDIPPVDLGSLLHSPPRLAVLLAGVADPGNAGTIIRTAAAAGAGLVAVTRGGVDVYGGKCVRASAGAVLRLPIAVGAEAEPTIAAVRAAGVQVIAATIDGDDIFTSTTLSRPTAWLFGSEAHGLDPALAAAADARLRIPMAPGVESLNLAAAAAVCLYTSVRAQAGLGR